LGSLPETRPLELLMVTRDAQPAAGAVVERPEQAMALVLPRVIPEEYPHIRCGTVDLARSDLAPHALGRLAVGLVRELALIHDGHNPLAVAHRGADRYELSHEPERVEAGRREPALRPRGTCLITGGLGGIGLTLARHFAEASKARLVLLSRTGLP